MRRLNLGCNEWNLEGFVNIDQLVNFPKILPDVVCDALALPFSDSCFDEIYAGHILEHFSMSEGDQALREWHRVLRRGGTITITVPDIELGLKDLLAGRITLEWFNQIVYGSSERKGQDHYQAFTQKLLADRLRGFFSHVKYSLDSPHLVARVTWQSIVIARKD